MKRIFWVLIALSVVASVCVCVEEVEGEKNEEVEEPPRMRMFVITEECYEKLIVKKEMDGACIKKTLAKIIGYSIVILASIVKVPQIIKIMAAGSTEGIDDQSFYFEFIAYTVSLFYSVHTLQPFSAYGETAFLSFQSLILLFLLWSYNKKKYTFKMISFQLFLMSVGIYVLYKDTIVSDPLWKLLFGISNPLIMIGRVFQIYTNFKNRSTGQLSFLMMLMFAMGCAARVFTTLQEVDDTLVLAMFLCNLVFNFIIVIQILLYWNSGKKKSD